jgi:hypothetical protein
LHKIRELFDYFCTACRSHYLPGENIALDEAIKKFKGRCVFKQYIKNKPGRWGIKIYCVACSDSAYLCNAEFYVGKAPQSPDLETGEDKSLLQQLAVRLLLPFSGHNRVVHIDNYYTSIPLVLELQNINILTTGIQ